jgi:hypothetical protein
VKLLSLSLMFFFLVGCDNKQPINYSSPDISVFAEDMIKAYEENEARADMAFNGKVIKIQGEVDDITKNFMDEVVVGLAVDGTLLGISAPLAEGQDSVAANINKGDWVTVICVGAGEMMSRPILNDCVIK